MKYNKEKKYFEIETYDYYSSYLEASTISTKLCPIKKEFCVRWYPDSLSRIPERCDRFVEIEGDLYLTFTSKKPLKILCRGNNSILFINED